MNSSDAAKKRWLEFPKVIYNVQVEQFLDIKDRNVAYFLGYLWADGWINCNNNILMSLRTSDMQYLLKNTFHLLGKWNLYRGKEYKKNTSTIHTSNKHIVNFLTLNNYKNKSLVSPSNILEKIPENLRKYFWRGFIDGDGCFYIPKRKNAKFNVWGSINQDWSDFLGLLLSLGIDSFKLKKYKRLKSNGKIHSSSTIGIYNQSSIILMGNYIYCNYLKDNLGLKRKYQKFLKIKNYYETKWTKL